MKAACTALVFVLIGAGGCRTAPVLPPSAFPYSNDVSLRGFAEEALHGHGTPRTHRFDDYTKGSYHVRPDEVVNELFRVAPIYKLQLQAVVVVGSYGPLWAFDVITVLSGDNCSRINWLTMPHARITAKWSGCVSSEAASAFVAEVLRAAPVREPGRDGGCVVFGDGREVRRSASDCHSTPTSAELDRLQGALNGLRAGLSVTYSSVNPEK